MVHEQLTTCYNTIAFPLYVKSRCVGGTCNLQCSFCKESSAEDRLHEMEPMDMKTLEIFIEKYSNAQIHTDVQFEWVGGEPLLAGISFFQKALQLQEKYRHKKGTSNTIVSNGTLLNDEWCSFLKRNNFKMIIQLDGPQACHDYYRVTKDQVGSFAETMNGTRLLKKYNIPFHIRATIHDYNVNFPLEVYQFFRENRLNHIEFIPLVQKRQGHLSPESVPSLSWGKFLCDIFDEWVRKDVGRMHIKLFENTLNIFSNQETDNCIYSSHCGHTAIIGKGGKIYSCENHGSQEHYLGHIEDDTITGMMYGRKQLRFGQQKRSGLTLQCKKCAHLRLCHGGCINHRVGLSASGERFHNILCLGYQRFFDHASPAMVFMAEEIQRGGSASRIMSFFQSMT